MTVLPKPSPKLFKLVPRPGTVPDSEVAKARPIYIDGLEGGASEISDITGLQAIIDDLTDRVAALEAAGA